MRPSRERVVASAVAFAQHSHPQDEIFVARRSTKRCRKRGARRVVADMNPAQFASAMSAAIMARGMTAIYDGIMSGLSRLERARHTRQVLIVVSDGGDNASKAKLEDDARRACTIPTRRSTPWRSSIRWSRTAIPRLLRRLARLTGGEAYQPRRVEDVPEAFERISKDIRNAYTLAYVPTKSAPAPRRAPPHRQGLRAIAGRPRAARCARATAISRRRTRSGQ